MHPLIWLAMVATLISLGFSLKFGISLVFGFALFLSCVPLLVGGYVIGHYVYLAWKDKWNWWP